MSHKIKHLISLIDKYLSLSSPGISDEDFNQYKIGYS